MTFNKVKQPSSSIIRILSSRRETFAETFANGFLRIKKDGGLKKQFILVKYLVYLFLSFSFLFFFIRETNLCS